MTAPGTVILLALLLSTLAQAALATDPWWLEYDITPPLLTVGTVEQVEGEVRVAATADDDTDVTRVQPILYPEGGENRLAVVAKDGAGNAGTDLLVILPSLAPGTPIRLEAFWEVGGVASGHYVGYCVVENPAIARRVYCAAPLRRYKDKLSGEWRSWADPALAGVKVRIQSLGSMWPVDGVATNRGTVVVNGEEEIW